VYPVTPDLDLTILPSAPDIDAAKLDSETTKMKICPAKQAMQQELDARELADFLPSPSALSFDEAVATVDDAYDNESFLAVVCPDESYRTDFSQAIQEFLGAVFDSPCPTFSLSSPALTSPMHVCKHVAKVTRPTPVTPMSERSGHEHAVKKEPTHHYFQPLKSAKS
jgi:hypothetical protein